MHTIWTTVVECTGLQITNEVPLVCNKPYSQMGGYGGEGGREVVALQRCY